ncbi:MAG TPA: hypothetical protein VKE74_17640 [Gemmataceae bacterium]|nr:hypothetical protein [Gemmataceae bacterium]
MTRPRDFALFLLGSGDLAPRQRARDQQADAAGLELKRRVLAGVVAGDPEPDELEAALMNIVDELGPPTGPTRAVALGVLEEWRFAASSPGWVPHLLGEAVGEPREKKGGRRGGNLPA